MQYSCQVLGFSNMTAEPGYQTGEGKFLPTSETHIMDALPVKPLSPEQEAAYEASLLDQESGNGGRSAGIATAGIGGGAALLLILGLLFSQTRG